jgi:Putative DNA-binding domain
MNALSLAQQQQALVAALRPQPGPAAADAARLLLDLLAPDSAQNPRGIDAYRTNARALAVRALTAVYPVVAAMIGQDNFARLAQDMWHHHPPTCGDLAQWGEALPAYLPAIEELAGEPFLSDVARIEWALHRAAGAGDTVPDLPSFARLVNEAPDGLSLTLAPGTTVIASPHPVASLVNAHLLGTPTLAEAAQRLRDGQGEHALVWRQGLRPRVVSVAPDVAFLLQALQDGADLPQALQAATARPDSTLDFATWLSAAVTEEWVTGVHRLDNGPATHLSIDPPFTPPPSP